MITAEMLARSQRTTNYMLSRAAIFGLIEHTVSELLTYYENLGFDVSSVRESWESGSATPQTVHFALDWACPYCERLGLLFKLGALWTALANCEADLQRMEVIIEPFEQSSFTLLGM